MNEFREVKQRSKGINPCLKNPKVLYNQIRDYDACFQVPNAKLTRFQIIMCLLHVSALSRNELSPFFLPLACSTPESVCTMQLWKSARFDAAVAI